MATYTTLREVKDLLQARYKLQQGGRRIDFSEAYKNLAPGPNNGAATIKLGRVDFDDSFVGNVQFAISFTDTTSFDAVMVPDPSQTEISLGSGDRFNSFVALNPFTGEDIFAIEPDYWTGVALAGSLVSWESNSVFSNEEGEEVIRDAEFLIDSGILRYQKIYSSNRQSLLFTGATIPGPLSRAAKYLAAFLFYQRVNPVANLSESEVFQWYQLAKNLIDQYVESLPTPGPQWVSRPPIVSSSDFDDIGGPSFEALDYRESAWITFEAVQERLRKYQKNVDYINYSPPANLE